MAHATVRAVVINPAVAGLRIHRRQIAGPGTWQPILDRPLWEQTRAALSDPARKRTRPARRYLLASMVTNSAGDPLIGCPDKTGRLVYATGPGPDRRSPSTPSNWRIWSSRPSSRCSTRPPCPHPTPRAAPRPGGDRPPRRRAGRTGRLRGTGEISLAEWMAARKPLQERIEAARKIAGTPRRARATPHFCPSRGRYGMPGRPSTSPHVGASSALSSSASPSPAPTGAAGRTSPTESISPGEPEPSTLAAWTACSVVAAELVSLVGHGQASCAGKAGSAATDGAGRLLVAPGGMIGTRTKAARPGFPGSGSCTP